MWVKTQAVTLSVVCSAAVVVTSAAPVPPITDPTPTHSAEYRYALTAAAFDAAFNPIRYAGNVGGAAQAVATDVIYWQTPDFPLLVLSAQVDSTTGQYEAVQKVTSTTAHLQSLLSAVTAFPGASSSPQVRQLVSGIGSAGAAAADATRTVTATLAPHLAPLTPVIYVVRVARAAVGVYYAVATLSTTGIGTVLSGQNPVSALANVVSSVQGLANVLTHPPRPASSVSTGATAESTATTAASRLAAKPSAAAIAKSPAGADVPHSRADADVSGKRSAKRTKSEEKHEESAPAEGKSDTKKSKRAAKSEDTSPKAASAKAATAKEKSDHGRRKD
jgi:hypothetical protein